MARGSFESQPGARRACPNDAFINHMIDARPSSRALFKAQVVTDFPEPATRSALRPDANLNGAHG
jgi:hypothetical protein